jgi:hypothetical protein
MDEASGTGRALYAGVSIQAIAQHAARPHGQLLQCLARAVKPSEGFLYQLADFFRPEPSHMPILARYFADIRDDGGEACIHEISWVP